MTGFDEVCRDEVQSQSPGGGLLPDVFDRPASEHRGVEVGGRWIAPEDWRATPVHTHDDQGYTIVSESLRAGSPDRPLLPRGPSSEG